MSGRNRDNTVIPGVRPLFNCFKLCFCTILAGVNHHTLGAMCCCDQNGAIVPYVINKLNVATFTNMHMLIRTVGMCNVSMLGQKLENFIICPTALTGVFLQTRHQMGRFSCHNALVPYVLGILFQNHFLYRTADEASVVGKSRFGMGSRLGNCTQRPLMNVRRYRRAGRVPQ